MKTKHTKGPWKTHLTRRQSIEIWPEEKGSGRICTLMNRNAIEEDANAKLITAAPELLQNCIWCINNFKDVLPVATKKESKRIYSSLIKNLEQAIKKATQ